MGTREADLASQAERLIAQLSAAETLLEKAGMFGELDRGISLWAAASREHFTGEVRQLCERVLREVLDRVMTDVRPGDANAEDAKRLAEGHLASTGQDTGKLQRLLRDLVDLHEAAVRIDDAVR